jgi:hypothetical protein
VPVSPRPDAEAASLPGDLVVAAANVEWVADPAVAVTRRSGSEAAARTVEGSAADRLIVGNDVTGRPVGGGLLPVAAEIAGRLAAVIGPEGRLNAGNAVIGRPAAGR